jgi:serine/threonine protein phosphatase PrpC
LIEAAGATDRGTVRTENQDAWDAVTLPDGDTALILADGMGGHVGGRESAEAAVGAAAASLAEGGVGESPEQAIAAAAARASQGVAAVRDEIGGNPGTTLVLAVVAPSGTATVGNIGDSRAYLVHRGSAEPISHDHSWVGEQMREGLLDANEGRHHPRRNIITRAVMGDPVEADVFHLTLEPGDALLLVSDGVWEPLTDEMIAELLTDSGPLQAALDRMCQAALDAGSKDNVTAVAARRLP